MLLFSTLLEINGSMTKDDFIELVIEWNQKSPHKENVIPNIKWNGEHNIRFGDEGLWLDIQEYRNKNIIAVRYEKRESDGSIWDTDYVMNFTDMEMSVRLDRSYAEDAIMVNPGFSTPHFITLLIERGYLSNDVDLPVNRDPFMIKEKELGLISEIVKGNKHYRLPVVFVSRTYYDEDPVNIKRLAGRLKGVAHVLAQESNITNPRLRELCDGENEYNGRIGIYYPNQTLGHKRYFPRSTEGNDSFLLDKIVRQVIQYSNSKMIDTLYTWQGVNNALLRDRLQSQNQERLAAEAARKQAEEETTYILESLDEEEQRIKLQAKEEARREADALIENFDDDMRRLQKQVDELTRANDALVYENQGLKSKLYSGGTISVLNMGDEDEFYPGEVKDILLSVLTDSLKNLPVDSRRMDVVKDIINSNDFQKQSDKKAEEIKRLLKDYNGISTRLKQDLENLGFELTEEGKHLKLTYYGDSRYYTAIAKTPSDGRSGMNSAMQIIRSMF